MGEVQKIWGGFEKDLERKLGGFGKNLKKELKRKLKKILEKVREKIWLENF
ncbi:MAG: hypothetical protein NC293_05975 [Roseburia sp.]|nr:hypothetical protein [Roseburia sp.]